MPFYDAYAISIFSPMLFLPLAPLPPLPLMPPCHVYFRDVSERHDMPLRYAYIARATFSLLSAADAMPPFDCYATLMLFTPSR